MRYLHGAHHVVEHQVDLCVGLCWSLHGGSVAFSGTGLDRAIGSMIRLPRSRISSDFRNQNKGTGSLELIAE